MIFKQDPLSEDSQGDDVCAYVLTLRQTTPCFKKTVQVCFYQNFIKFPLILKMFGTKMVKRLQLCEVYQYSSSPSSCHHTSVLNADVPNC